MFQNFKLSSYALSMCLDIDFNKCHGAFLPVVHGQLLLQYIDFAGDV